MSMNECECECECEWNWERSFLVLPQQETETTIARAMCHACWFVRMHCIPSPLPLPVPLSRSHSRCRCQLYWPENHKALCVQSRVWEREEDVERKSSISLSPSLAVGHSVSSSSFFLTFFPFIPEILARAYSIFVCVAQFDFPLHDYNPFSLSFSLSLLSFQLWVSAAKVVHYYGKLFYKLTGSKQDLPQPQTQSEMLRRRVFPNEDQELPCEHDRKSSSIRVVGVCVCVCGLSTKTVTSAGIMSCFKRKNASLIRFILFL